jgi:hypothetical protein
MPQKIFETKSNRRITKFLWSNAWLSAQPWEHKKQPIPYIWWTKEASESGDVSLTYVYVGPFGLISGKWIREEEHK